MLIRRIGKAAFCLVVFISLLLLSACSRQGGETPPSSAHTSPIYPDSSQVVTGTFVIRGNGEPAQTLMFQTNRSTQAVQEYYRNVLTKDGWENCGGVNPRAEIICFSWKRGCPISTMDIDAKLGSNGQTNVEVTLKLYGCE